MSALKLTVFARNATRICNFQRNNFTTIRQFASKIGEPKKKSSALKLMLIGTVIGAGAGSIYSVYDNIGKKKTTKEELVPHILDEFPDVPVMRRIINSNDKTGLDLVLFQFQTCPFCCKVRAFLDFSGLSYSVVEVDAVLRQSIKWSDSKKVPTMLARTSDGKWIQLNDSSVIISVLSSYLIDPVKSKMEDLVKFYPVETFSDVYGTVHDIANKYFLMFQDKKPKEPKEYFDEERQWRNWADHHLVHLISPNVYRTYDEARETFEWFSECGQWSSYFPSWERDLMVHVGTIAMYLISKRLTKRHGLGDDPRGHLYEACDKFTSELERKKTKFMGGKEPNLADLAVFGILSSMEGCQAFKDCLENTKIGSWFNDLKGLIDKNRGQRKPIALHRV